MGRHTRSHLKQTSSPACSPCVPWTSWAQSWNKALGAAVSLLSTRGCDDTEGGLSGMPGLEAEYRPQRTTLGKHHFTGFAYLHNPLVTVAPQKQPYGGGEGKGWGRTGLLLGDNKRMLNSEEVSGPRAIIYSCPWTTRGGGRLGGMTSPPHCGQKSKHNF